MSEVQYFISERINLLLRIPTDKNIKKVWAKKKKKVLLFLFDIKNHNKRRIISDLIKRF